MARVGAGWIRSLGRGLFGGDGGHEVGGRFIHVLGHPQYGATAGILATAVASLEANPGGAAAMINGPNGLAAQAVNIPGAEKALADIVAACTPTFNAAAFNTGVEELEVALEGATTSAPATGWMGRIGEHLRNMRGQPGHVGGLR